jgi:enoyl-CoA hydratase/carnithine racemase
MKLMPTPPVEYSDRQRTQIVFLCKKKYKEQYDMKFDYLTCRYDGNIAVVTINNPPVNAMSSEAYGELDQIFYDLSVNRDLRAVILTAECEKNIFVAGSNVKEFPSMSSDNGTLYIKRNNRVRFGIYRCPVPVICALNGSAIGGGLGIALMCDYRITHPKAKFAVGEVTMGVLSFTQFLGTRIHSGTARKMVYGGIQIAAEEGLRAGLIDEVVHAEEVFPRALELARRIAVQSPIAVRLGKECMLKAEAAIFEMGGQDFEDACDKVLWGTEDQKEAVDAFLEKRQPQFKNY